MVPFCYLGYFKIIFLRLSCTCHLYKTYPLVNLLCACCVLCMRWGVGQVSFSSPSLPGRHVASWLGPSRKIFFSFFFFLIFLSTFIWKLLKKNTSVFIFGKVKYWFRVQNIYMLFRMRMICCLSWNQSFRSTNPNKLFYGLGGNKIFVKD